MSLPAYNSFSKFTILATDSRLQRHTNETSSDASRSKIFGEVSIPLPLTSYTSEDESTVSIRNVWSQLPIGTAS